jgi:hypothetical protein
MLKTYLGIAYMKTFYYLCIHKRKTNKINYIMENMFIVVSATTNCGGELEIRKESNVVNEQQANEIFTLKKEEFKSIANEQNEQANTEVYAIEIDTPSEFTIYDYGTDIMSVKIISL